jgi:hypothetical protein
MMAAPAWYGAGLTDVNTGTAFKVADWKGKVVLVEITAVQPAPLGLCRRGRLAPRPGGQDGRASGPGDGRARPAMD